MSSVLQLCATTRLAQVRRAAVPRGAAAPWLTPQALSVWQWLAGLAEQALLTGQLLPQPLMPDAEQVLWQQVIEASLGEQAVLFDAPGLAKTAMEAQALCRRWGLSASRGSDEARQFAEWQQAFEQRCQSGGWIDAAGFEARVIDLLAAGAFELPAVVEFHGFDRLTRLEEGLIAALQARACQVEFPTVDPPDEQKIQVWAGADRDAECHAAVAWARDWLAREPKVRLGIVVPDLASVRDRLACLLDDALHPASLRPDGSEMPRNYNISLGRALAERPLVKVALELLALGGGRRKIEQKQLSTLLLGAFWSAADNEADGRAQLDARQRRDLPALTTVQALVKLAERLAARGELACPQSIAALSAGCALLADASGRQLPSRWAEIFQQALLAFAWPGERALSSHEFQARRAFDEVLAGLAAYDELLGPVSQAMALARLWALCLQRLFQPETRGEPAIQVLGILESAGLQFDGLWLLGMNDDVWPPAPRPNPLLAIEAQRAAAAAHASAEVELDFARRVQTRLLAAAGELHFSYARADGNRLLRPSPLLASLPPAVDCTQRVKTLGLHLLDERGAACEWLDDAQAPALAPGERVEGGSALLRAQAICPAWAFYQYRLAARALDEPQEGLPASARGSLLHAVLEHFWGEVQTSTQLHALLPAALRATIARAVDSGLAAFEQDRQISLPPRFRALEAARLARLVERWLAIERERPQAFEVVAREREALVEIEGIAVRMIIDRIDRLDDDAQLVIDYKTGQAIDTANWASTRLSEPQLPIYAALVADDVAGVAFAKVRLDAPAFVGVCDVKDRLPGVPGLGDGRQKIFPAEQFADWPAVLEHWRERLHAVAREVADGIAGVVVYDAPGLRYCEVLPLLRLAERQGWQSGKGEDTA